MHGFADGVWGLDDWTQIFTHDKGESNANESIVWHHDQTEILRNDTLKLGLLQLSFVWLNASRYRFRLGVKIKLGQTAIAQKGKPMRTRPLKHHPA